MLSPSSLTIAVVLLETQLVWSLQCYECVGSEASDCAKGINSAAVEVDCAPLIMRVAARNYLRTGSTESQSTSVPPGAFVPMPTQKPFVPYPACVSFTKVPYRSRNKLPMVHRRCLVSGEHFCDEYLQKHPTSKCQQCNNTNFCV